MKKYSWCKLILKLLCKQATPSAAKNVNNKTGPLTTGPLTTCTKQTTLFGPNGLFKFTAGSISKADSKPGFKIFQDPVEAKKPGKIEAPPEHFRSVQVQTKLSAHPRDSLPGKSVGWTIARKNYRSNLLWGEAKRTHA